MVPVLSVSCSRLQPKSVQTLSFTMILQTTVTLGVNVLEFLLLDSFVISDEEDRRRV